MSKKDIQKIKSKKKSIRKENTVQLISVILIVILINFISSSLFTRIDLTAEKRYSLSDETKSILKKVDDIVFFKVYLKGDFPAGFKRLENSTKELLDEMHAYNKNIQYQFINPSESDDVKERNDTYKLLQEKGLNPTTIQVRNKDGVSQQIVFPSCIMSYKGDEIPIELFQENKIETSNEQALNNSIQNLEFLLISNIQRYTRSRKFSVGVLQGHDELTTREAFSFLTVLQKEYSVEEARIDGNINALSGRFGNDSIGYTVRNKYDALIIPGPKKPFSDQDKFVIDQFIMHGGKVLWLANPVYASMDSIQHAESTVGIKNDINFSDMLFKYGVRMNDVILEDLNCNSIALTVGMTGNRPNIDFFPWPFFPLVSPGSNHPIVKNLDLISTRFPGTLDILDVDGIKSSVLLSSSPNTKEDRAPAIISLSILKRPLDDKLYNQGVKNVAVLLEGNFNSAFKNRVPQELASAEIIDFKEKSDETAMIVISDANIIKNQFLRGKGYPLPLGYDQDTRRTFGNQNFILNAINYLTYGPDLISLRSREVELRPLDMNKVSKEKLKWQLINTIAPLVLLCIIGFAHFFIRRKKYKH